MKHSIILSSYHSIIYIKMLNISPTKVREQIDTKKYKAFGQFIETHASRVLAYWLLGTLGLLLFLAILPWRQTIITRGDLTTMNPNQRPQNIHSIIAGRIEKWYVQEGDFVNKGDTIVHISDIKETYYDPDLLTRTREQLEAKRQAVSSYSEKAEALGEQLEALKRTQALKLEQARNVLRQAQLQWQSDSIQLEAAKTNYTIAQRRIARWEELYKDGLISLTDLESRKMSVQQTKAEQISAENKLISTKNDILNAKMEISSLQNQYLEKIAKVESDRFNALSSKFDAQGMAAKLQNQLKNYTFRFGIYFITAPQDGYVTRATATGIGQTIKEGENLVTFMPADFELAVQMFVRPIDLPLIQKGQDVRLMFDGWPSIVFSGWPNLSYGTFGGEVVAYDKFISPNGKYRVLVAPDPEEVDWPDALRIGSGAKCLALLATVPVWYEVWRQLSGFPPNYYNAQEQENMDKDLQKKPTK
jgi:membrane fusion protein, adhesin transport system